MKLIIERICEGESTVKEFLVLTRFDSITIWEVLTAFKKPNESFYHTLKEDDAFPLDVVP